MNSTDLKDKAISLIVWNSAKEDDVRVYLGKLQVENSKTYFVNEEDEWKVFLDSEQLRRLRSVPEDLKETLLNADYAFSMSMGDLSQLSLQGYQTTGMKWDD